MRRDYTHRRMRHRDCGRDALGDEWLQRAWPQRAWPRCTTETLRTTFVTRMEMTGHERQHHDARCQLRRPRVDRIAYQLDSGRTPAFLLPMSGFKSMTSFGFLIETYMGHVFWLCCTVPTRCMTSLFIFPTFKRSEKCRI